MPALLARRGIPARKDKAPDSGSPEALAADYRSLVLRARREQLQATTENLQRLQATFDGAAQSVLDRIKALPDTGTGIARRQFYLQLLIELDRILTRLAEDYGDRLQVSMLEVAQKAADREAEAANLVGAKADRRLLPDLSRTLTLTTGAEVSVSFGKVALGAVDAVARRVYADNLKLSERLYQLNQDTRRVIGDTIVQGVAEGLSARDLGRRLESHLRDGMTFAPTASEAERRVNVRNRANLIARTEINNAHREASIFAMQDEDGNLKPYVQAVNWGLSGSHPRADICDLYASDDSDGLGEGNYLPDNVPLGHPRCLCMITAVLVAYPDQRFTVKEPDTANVPPSQVRYAAGRGDAVAQRWLEKYGGAEQDGLLASGVVLKGWVTINGKHVYIGGGDDDGGSGGTGGEQETVHDEEKTPSPSAKAMLAKQSAHYVGADIQRYSEEHNEPILAKGLGGLSLRDNEPVDVLVIENGRVAHGVELKTMVDNKASKITMKRDAMERKAAWMEKNHAPYHTVVFDDHAVFNARGNGKHGADADRTIYYKRGFGSFRVSSMHKVEDMAELNRLMNTRDADLPAASRPPASYPGVKSLTDWMNRLWVTISR